MEEKIIFRCDKKDCIWRSNSYLHSCDYSQHHEHTRVKGLPKDKWDPKYCDKYERGKKATKSREFKIPLQLDYERIEQLYKRGLNDAEIGREVKCSPTKVADWRKRNKLKSNSRRSNKVHIDTVEATELYRMGYSDGHIGRHFNCSADTIRTWRIAHGLPAHKNVGSPGRVDWIKGRELHKQGFTDTQMAAILDCHPDAVRRWRRKEKLPANQDTARRTKIGPKLVEQIVALNRRGLQDPEIALILEICPHSIQRRRAELKLQNNSSAGRRCVELDIDTPVNNGLYFDKQTERWWVIRENKIIGAAKTELEAAKIFEERK